VSNSGQSLSKIHTTGFVPKSRIGPTLKITSMRGFTTESWICQ